MSSPIYAHTLNAAPFLEGLAARGAEVHWGVATPWAGGVAAGAEVWDTGPVLPFSHRGGRIRGVSARYDWLIADSAARLRAVQRVIDEVRPDVVLTDSLAHAAALESERLGLPWVSFGDGPLHFPDQLTPPFGAGLPYRTMRPWAWRNSVVQAASRQVIMAPAQRRYAALRGDLGLPRSETPVLEAVLSPLLHLHCGAPELEYPRAHLPDHVHFVGALHPPARECWEPPTWWQGVVEDHSGEVVLVTQGTLRDDPREVLRPALAALTATGRPAVLTTGAADPSSLGGPGSVDTRDGAAVAVESFVPYERVLPHASAFVTNGGWTGVLLALAHGIPVLQVGRTEEKADIGRRVEWAGAGLHLGDARPTPHRIRRALERLEDPQYRQGARRIAASLATRDPGRDGAWLVDRLMSRRAGTTTR
ncbi:MAG: nucleotide disphospho-sugar-binding domain-containing protein [Dermatophilaceae bacterium]|nr:glycosyltransferase [Intrasporangiaceae bacterium]